jgi:glycogen operon protein
MQKSPLELSVGKPFPLGATLLEDGVNFAIFSANAERVDLCLFDSPDSAEGKCIRIYHCTNQIWHIFAKGLKAGQCYGYRVHGPHKPEEGHRFNPAKLLLDPYAKAISGDVHWGPEMFSYRFEESNPDKDVSKDDRNNAHCMPKSVVIDPEFDWQGDKGPNIPMSNLIIYEAHVKGFSKLWKKLPENIRGTYAGIGSEPACAYFKELGMTAIELLPVHHRIDSKILLDRGLSDYWGYNSIGFFAPDCRFSSGGCLGQQVTEFKTMVKNLHAAGLEVILDVVYNHTSEGNHLGPTLSFRGIDNAVYYRLNPDNRRYYFDYTGTGNTLAVYRPDVLQLVMDSLRYWITEMHVDGFRFDLAASLARELQDVSHLSSFFDVIHQDPVISQVKLIAEPWDLGQDGYLVGKFPVLWSEWNGKYRDTVRRYWKGDRGCIADFARRLSGSADLYEYTGKTPSASVNFITAHDGYALADLVSFQETHNEANGEENRDGEKNNLSWNCGIEGPTQDDEIGRLRRRQQRNFLATLFLSQGVPMLRGGDEAGKSQGGNNNAYCQDNAISWLNWEHNEDARRLKSFVSGLAALRRDHPVFRRLDFFRGRPVRGGKIEDVLWLNTGGRKMTNEEWNSDQNQCFAMFLGGNLLGADGNPINDDFFLVCFNASHEPVTFKLPTHDHAYWNAIMRTDDESGILEKPVPTTGELSLERRSICVLFLELASNADRASVAEQLSRYVSES